MLKIKLNTSHIASTNVYNVIVGENKMRIWIYEKKKKREIFV